VQSRERQRPAADLEEPPNPAESIRRFYAAACLATLFVAAHISFVPYHFRAPEWSAIQRMLEDAMRPGIYSRANFVANVLMFVPVGFSGAGALAVRKHRAHSRLAAIAGLSGAVLAASVVLEGMQLFLAERTPTITDVAAQVAGAFAGMSLFQVAGGLTTASLTRAKSQARENPALPLLQVAAAFFIIASLVPLDVTLSGSTLARKYREGLILLVPFSDAVTADWVPAIVADLLMTAPIGALAALMFPPRSAIAAAGAWSAGFLVIAGVELCQVIVRSRVADVTDVVVGSVGVAGGIAAARVLFSAAEPGVADRRRMTARVALAIALALYAVANWSPFNFTISGMRVGDRLSALVQVPFYSYYLAAELQAFTTLATKLATLLPIVLLTAVAARTNGATPRRLLGFAFVLVCFFAIVEFGQVFLPTRFPDSSDIILGGGAVAATLAVDLRLRRKL
jgi:glycopeptide antibiotics resistance protein